MGNRTDREKIRDLKHLLRQEITQLEADFKRVQTDAGRASLSEKLIIATNELELCNQHQEWEPLVSAIRRFEINRCLEVS